MSRSLDSLNQQGGSGVGSDPTPQLRQVGGLLERPDGNNVLMDREGMKMAEAQLQFRTGVELLKHEFSRVMDANPRRPEVKTATFAGKVGKP